MGEKGGCIISWKVREQKKGAEDEESGSVE